MGRMLRKANRRLQRSLQWIWQQEGTPRQRARGLAAGIFCGCFPIFGLQTLVGIALASVVRGNHLLAAKPGAGGGPPDGANLARLENNQVNITEHGDTPNFGRAKVTG